MVPRIVQYQQTYHRNGEYQSLLPLLDHACLPDFLILAAIHLNQMPGDITLNDHPPFHERHKRLWEEVAVLKLHGVTVLGMLGGAAKGSFTRLDGLDWVGRGRWPWDWETYYNPLRDRIREMGLQGLDLDVEEDMSVGGVCRLVERLKADFGDGFIITMAPVATALSTRDPRFNISGFDYTEVESKVGRHIAWYNCQFYNNWGVLTDTELYEKIIRAGWPSNKVIAGMITNPEAGAGWVPDEMLRETLQRLLELYSDFGGVMGWEYFGSITVAQPYGFHWSWAKLMKSILGTAEHSGASAASAS